jgi:hypothetical protein
MKEARDHGFTKEEIINFLKNPELVMDEYLLENIK